MLYLLHDSHLCEAVRGYSTAHNQIELISGSGAVALQFRYVEILSLFHHVSRYLRALYIFWSLVRHRVTRRLTGLQTMHAQRS